MQKIASQRKLKGKLFRLRLVGYTQ